MNVNGKSRLIDRTKPGREWMYVTHEAKDHDIPLALGNTLSASSSDCMGATNSFKRAWKPRSVQIGRE